MTDEDQMAVDYDRALTERILDRPDTFFTLEDGALLTAKVGIHSVVLTPPTVRGFPEGATLVPGHRINQLIDWLTDVRDGCIEPATVGEERW